MVYLAKEKGFFRDAGVEVELLDFGSLADVRLAYEFGKIDGLTTTIVDVLMARDARPRDLRIVRLIDYSDGADMIVAREGVRSMRDLRGKRIGVELASLGIYVLVRALEREGMTLSDVTPVSQDQQTMCDGLLGGELDAVVTYPPQSVALQADPRFRVVFSSRDIPGEVVDVVAIDGEILRQRPAQVAAFGKALDRAFEYMQQHPEEAFRIMAEREGLPAREFQRLLTTGITLVAPDEQAAYFGQDGKLKSVIQTTAGALQGVKLISARPEIADCLGKP